MSVEQNYRMERFISHGRTVGAPKPSTKLVHGHKLKLARLHALLRRWGQANQLTYIDHCLKRESSPTDVENVFLLRDRLDAIPVL